MIALLVAGALAAPANVSGPLILSAQMVDYPAAALTAGQKGDVPVVLHIDADGRLGCRVIGASDLTLLRRPSCILVASRWTFALARDPQGRPVPADIAIVVRWKPADASRDPREDFGGAIPVSQDRWVVPDDYPLEAIRSGQSGKVLIAFGVGADGKVGECVVEEPAKPKDLGKTACAAIKMRALLLPALGPDGAPHATRARLVVRFTLPTH